MLTCHLSYVFPYTWKCSQILWSYLPYTCVNGSEGISPGEYFKDKLLIYSYCAGILRIISAAREGVCSQ